MSDRSPSRPASVHERFAQLHANGIFVMPNAWDIGSARILESMGFPAIATTSSGHAASLGKLDQHVTLDELLGHAEALAAAVDVPVSVDAERGFAEDPAALADNIRRFAETGAAGLSIEDYNPASGIDPLSVATERVAAAAEAAREQHMVLTARAENHLYGVDDLDDTVERLVAYRAAGADVVYAPGLVDLDDVRRLVTEVGGPVNVLALHGAPSVDHMAAAGVRRISTGGSLAFAAYGALAAAANELRSAGTSTYAEAALPADIRAAAFGE